MGLAFFCFQGKITKKKNGVNVHRSTTTAHLTCIVKEVCNRTRWWMEDGNQARAEQSQRILWLRPESVSCLAIYSSCRHGKFPLEKTILIGFSPTIAVESCPIFMRDGFRIYYGPIQVTKYDIGPDPGG